MNDLLLQILMPLAGAAGGVGISELFHWRSSVRKAKAEATKAEAEATKEEAEAAKAKAEAKDAHIEAMGKVFDQMQEQEDKYIEQLNNKDARIEEVLQQNIAIRSEATSAELLMCVNLGCYLRRPAQGQGKMWYDTHSGSADMGANYIPLNVLMKLYGEKKQRMIQEAQGDSEETRENEDQ